MLRISLVIAVTAALLGFVTPADAFLNHVPSNGRSLNGIALDKGEMQVIFQQDRRPSAALPSNPKDEDSRAPLSIDVGSAKATQPLACMNCFGFVKCCP
jgi:hypothetical protein